MSTASVPLQDLAARIQQQEADLAQLRDELNSRRSQLSELTQRKEKLQAELAKVEKDIAAAGETIAVDPPASSARTPVITGSKTAAMSTDGVSLPTYLVELVRQAKQPITAKELADEVVRNKYPTTSKNLEGMVKTRVYDLVKKGALRRAKGSSGFVIGGALPSSKSAETKAPVAAQKIGKKPAAAVKPSPTPTAVQSPKWRSLHEVLTHVLAKSSRPLTAQELADRVIQSGYESKSKDLKNVIWVSIGKLSTVERIPGKGYQLKKGKASGAKRKA